MEYCAGGDLAHLLRRAKRLPEAAAQHLMRQLATGLRQMWAHHLVHVRGAGRWEVATPLGAPWQRQRRLATSWAHPAPLSRPAPRPPPRPRLRHLPQRDLKPQNLLLSVAAADATLKIADFGFARNLQPQARTRGPAAVGA